MMFITDADSKDSLQVQWLESRGKWTVWRELAGERMDVAEHDDKDAANIDFFARIDAWKVSNGWPPRRL